MIEYRLTVSYARGIYDIKSADLLVVGVLGEPAGSGAGFGVRDLEYYYPDNGVARAAERKILAAGLPLGLETDIMIVGCDHDYQEQPGEPPVDVCPKCGDVRE